MSSDPGQIPEGRPEQRREEPRGSKHDMFSSRLVVGVVISFLGVLFLADNLDLVNARHVIRALFPLALIGVGVVLVRGPDQRRNRSWGWVLITVGAWIFLDRIGWVQVSLWEMLIPGLLLFVGGSLVWRAVSGPRVEAPRQR